MENIKVAIDDFFFRPRQHCTAQLRAACHPKKSPTSSYTSHLHGSILVGASSLNHVQYPAFVAKQVKLKGPQMYVSLNLFPCVYFVLLLSRCMFLSLHRWLKYRRLLWFLMGFLKEGSVSWNRHPAKEDKQHIFLPHPHPPSRCFYLADLVLEKLVLWTYSPPRTHSHFYTRMHIFLAHRERLLTRYQFLPQSH